MITPEYLEDRITEFIAAREKCQADIAANNGAIQVCQHLLAQMNAEGEADAAQAETHETAGLEKAKANGEAAAP